MKLKHNLLFILLIAVFLVACGDKENTSEGNGTEDIKELVHEYSVGNISDETASITSEELIVTNSDGEEKVYSLPEDEFFVSIAPYINQTHPCTDHSLTGCQGEMIEKEVDVYIEDSEGNVIIDETMKTLENGFIDLWLPRDKTYNVTMDHDGKTVKSELSTFEQDGTCVTTMQLT